jgi:hypothetical protein
VPNTPQNTLLQAILQTVTYSDVFDYPLTASEIHKYLVGIQASPIKVQQALEQNASLACREIYFTLPERTNIVEIRKQREARSKQILPLAVRYGKILGQLPFIRMVALTGSLAVLNISDHADFDYMLVAAHGRVWTARAFALLFNRFVRPFGWAICPNLILAESSLAWHTHDLYSARELCQMIPIAGINVYRKLIHANEWIKDFLPNANLESNSLLFEKRKQASLLQKLLEFPLRGKLGDLFERWEMNRKIARFSKQSGFGEETIFSAEICQGNFDQHRKWTREVFEKKLNVIARRARPDEAISSFASEIASPASQSRNDVARL